MTRAILVFCGSLLAVIGGRPAPAAEWDADAGRGLLPLLEKYSAAAGDIRSQGSSARIEAAILASPIEEVLSGVRKWALGDVPLHRRFVAFRVLRLLPSRSALPVVLEISRDLTADEHSSPSIIRCLRRTLNDLIVRDSGVCRLLDAGWSRLTPGLRAASLLALEDAGGREAVHTLVGLLGRDPATTAGALEALARLPAVRSVHLGDRHCREVAALLGSSEPTIRRMAALATGRLHWAEACAQLVAMLNDEEDAVRTAAVRALKEMSGARLPADHVLWKAWLAREEAWLDRVLGGVCEGLKSGDAAQVIQSLLRLSRHRIHRDVFLDEIFPVLAHPSRRARVAACRALSGLGAPQAARRMLPLLEDPEEDVRDAARTALADLTGLAPPEDPDSWRKLLSSHGL